ncbi:hypothetical protein NNJEOMEG_02604 [Fundidesulfovibrio magnetotacticus]|uniref:Uncharacterized protein n=1 Tax=Fundidesulfovibrio magnetotacticus TaxID=2730080 RepID=A0A6V8LYN2_9BACT|nr:hypothetical protein NNJEOMEG_02604 [Fundidesulfovibrio magnetotacticus]
MLSSISTWISTPPEDHLAPPVEHLVFLPAAPDRAQHGRLALQGLHRLCVIRQVHGQCPATARRANGPTTPTTRDMASRAVPQVAFTAGLSARICSLAAVAIR